MKFPTPQQVAHVALIVTVLLSQKGLFASQQIEYENFTKLSLSQLESKLLNTNTEIEKLSHYNLRSGQGSIGYRSLSHSTPENKEWIEINLGKEYPIDEIVLVPTIRRDTNDGFQGDSFPAAFKVIAGNESSSQGTEITHWKTINKDEDRIAPLIIPTPDLTASFIRIETSKLSPRSFDGKFVFQLSEVFVFSGEENVALRQPVSTSSNQPDIAGAWDKRFLVDGMTPYLMDSSLGQQSIAYISLVGEQPSLTIDLKNEYPISRIHLHAVEQSDTVPQAYSGNLGIPPNLLIEGANKADFSDSSLLHQFRLNSLNDTGPILMWRIPQKSIRYVRISAGENNTLASTHPSMNRIGFAEIEFFSHGKNVAEGKPITVSYHNKTNQRSSTSLTDGNNLYGKILPIREWLNELALRHELEALRPLLSDQLAKRYKQQKKRLKYVSWLAGILALGICAIIIIDRFLQLRQMAKMKERFAADLHDELGANLHTIGLLSDLAIDSIDSREELIGILQQVRVYTERSGSAARNCTNMLEAKGICEDLVEAMNRSSRRLLTDLSHEIIFEGEEHLKKLKPRKRIDLFFFYKECLTNIIRHSGATKILTKLTANDKNIALTISDNGTGLSTSLKTNKLIPPSLKRRGRILKAQVSASSSNQGTTINLNLKIKRFWILK
ncbi:hypothetical protein MLD52_18805 [Puniceicoccaceae bacterium K14]|nr:hypothetical protein [Puniceicoccaceae bacterium K14]